MGLLYMISQRRRLGGSTAGAIVMWVGPAFVLVNPLFWITCEGPQGAAQGARPQAFVRATTNASPGQCRLGITRAIRQ